VEPPLQKLLTRGRAATDTREILSYKGNFVVVERMLLPCEWVCIEIKQTRNFEQNSYVNRATFYWSRHCRKKPRAWLLLMQERLLTTGAEIKSIYDARSIFKAMRSAINHVENNSACSFHRTAGFYWVTKSATRQRHCELGRNSFKVNTGMELLQTGRTCYGDFMKGHSTMLRVTWTLWLAVQAGFTPAQPVC